ncbi:hypothetical protein Q9L58_000626, partial [Maublancomyces gigas]
YSDEPLELRIGPYTTSVTPRGFLVLVDYAPFVAYTDPEYRLEMRRCRRHPRCDVSSDIDPGDIAILLAMTQAQQVNFPRRKSFKAFLIHPEEGGMSLVVLMADVTEHYLEGLRDLDRPFAASLEVRRAVVSLKDGFEKLLEVIKWIVESAPKIRKASKAGKTKMKCFKRNL